MDVFIIVLTGTVGVLGFGVAIWSFVTTGKHKNARAKN